MLPCFIIPVRVFDSSNSNIEFRYYLSLPSTSKQWEYDCVSYNREYVSVNDYKDEYPVSGHYLIKDVRIVSNLGIAVTSNRELILHTYAMLRKRDIKHYDTRLVKSFFYPIRQLKIKNAILISTEGQNGYYHWLHDSLPKLMGLEDYYRGSYKVIISGFQSKYIIESLEAFGIEEIVFASARTLILVEEIVIPELVSNIGNTRNEAVSFLRSKLITKRKILASRKIYISRANSKKRRILNEDEIVEFLISMGFIVYFMEEMSFTHQIEVFSEAAVIVASHGAGLANMIFCSKKTIIIEIFPNNYFEECYQKLSLRMNFKHRVIIEDNGDQNYNYFVNISNLKDELSKLRS